MSEALKQRIFEAANHPMNEVIKKGATPDAFVNGMFQALHTFASVIVEMEARLEALEARHYTQDNVVLELVEQTRRKEHTQNDTDS